LSQTPSAEAPPSSRDVHDILRPIRRVVAALMRSDALSHGDVDKALEQVTEVAAQVLRVKRASVWKLTEDQGAIECANLFDTERGRHSKGTRIAGTEVPRYFAALRSALSIAAHDARTDDRTSELSAKYLEPNGITSMLDAPVLLRGELVGIVCHEHVGPARKWHFWEELLASTLADFVAMVLGASEHLAQMTELAAYRTHLEDLVQERTKQLEHAEQRLRHIFETAPVALVLTRASDSAVLDANQRAAAMFERGLDDLGGSTTVDFWVDAAERERVLRTVEEGGFVEGQAVRLRTATGRELWAELSLRSMMLDGEACFLVGVRDVSDQKALEERLRELATTDGLTGIHNRRHFFELAEAEVARVERYGGGLSAAMIDVDHFKRLNDEHGHAVGDEALRTLASAARRVLRRVDILARYGGEEFVVLFPETDLVSASRVVERLRAAVAAEPIPGTAARITVSAGAVAWRAGEQLDATLRRADAALYRAKAEGRNRVVVEE
jgi:diguanylate cyclase (GGDEF)-like protein/PAS domain S-box-containing protein